MKILLVVTAILLTQLSGAAQTPQGSVSGRRDSYEATTLRGVVVGGKVVDKSGKSQPGITRSVTLSPIGSAVVTAASEGAKVRSSASSLKSSVRPDGSFEFPTVRPGQYMLRLDPHTPGTKNMQVDILSDIHNIEIVIPFRLEVTGRVLLEGRTLSPNTTVQAVQPIFTSATGIHDDGTFKLLLIEGENQISVARLPEELRVKKITFGTADITNAPLDVKASTTPREIVVSLETVSPAITVSRRR
jgi:hypothetical protein